MRQKMMALVVALAIAMLGMLTACSSEEPTDLEAVEATLATNPETVAAGSPVELQAAFTE